MDVPVGAWIPGRATFYGAGKHAMPCHDNDRALSLTLSLLLPLSLCSFPLARVLFFHTPVFFANLAALLHRQYKQLTERHWGSDTWATGSQPDRYMQL